MVVVTTFSKTKIEALYSTNLLVEKWSEIVETGIVLGNLQCVITKLKATLRLSQEKKGHCLSHTPYFLSFLVSWAYCIFFSSPRHTLFLISQQTTAVGILSLVVFSF